MGKASQKGFSSKVATPLGKCQELQNGKPRGRVEAVFLVSGWEVCASLFIYRSRCRRHATPSSVLRRFCLGTSKAGKFAQPSGAACSCCAALPPCRPPSRPNMPENLGSPGWRLAGAGRAALTFVGTPKVSGGRPPLPPRHGEPPRRGPLNLEVPASTDGLTDGCRP